MKGIIIYKSKYGAARQYARWISEETGFTCMDLKDADIRKISEYDAIILGGGIYASSIAGLSFLKKNISKLAGKKVIVYCCGASPFDKKYFDELKNRNMKGELSNIPVYYCRGTFDMNNMSFKDRTLCKMLRKAVAKKNPEEYEVWEEAFMSVGENEKGDWLDKSYIEPILKDIFGFVIVSCNPPKTVLL